jgi:toxin YoeB
MISFDDFGWEDYSSWVGEKKILARINGMIVEAERNPDVGIGKPERLTANLAGLWSRRITDEHRLVYRVDEHGITILSVRYHYDR